MAMGMQDAGHGWMDDVDSDDDLEVVIAVGILLLLLAAILPLLADLAPPQRLPRMGCFYKLYSLHQSYGLLIACTNRMGCFYKLYSLHQSSSCVLWLITELRSGMQSMTPLDVS
ncbi:hypothetical protein HaLaN_19656 [Haematococcus lacustris]|uniref:Uncharacterized protein n=1 Tax=Haematococcus lacustris TaxID=44745 RepID=A0A699ZHM7_HAELA|nr:hypothetical protein HaLaN_19656 [Haematococcus lacustris]